MNEKQLNSIIEYTITHLHKPEIMLKTQISSWISLVLRQFRPPSEKKISTLAQEDRIRHNFFSVPASCVELGRQKIQEGKYTQALLIFEECIEKQPSNVWAWHGKGDAAQFLGQYKNAEQSYRKATDLAPENALHWGGLANALFGQGKSEEATKIWNKTKKLDPSLVWMRPN